MIQLKENQIPVSPAAGANKATKQQSNNSVGEKSNYDSGEGKSNNDSVGEKSNTSITGS